MDGVLCDFDQAFKNISGNVHPVIYKKEKGKEQFHKLVADAGASYWADMPWMKDGKDLWNYIRKFKPTILSAPMTDVPECRSGKSQWIRKNLGPGLNVIFAEAPQKANWSDNHSILIDDWTPTTDAWARKGGVAINHKSARETIAKLRHIESEMESDYKKNMMKQQMMGMPHKF